MNFAKALQEKFNAEEWNLCGTYICKAQELYDANLLSEACETIRTARNICKENRKFEAQRNIDRYRRYLIDMWLLS